MFFIHILVIITMMIFSIHIYVYTFVVHISCYNTIRYTRSPDTGSMEPFDIPRVADHDAPPHPSNIPVQSACSQSPHELHTKTSKRPGQRPNQPPSTCSTAPGPLHRETQCEMKQLECLCNKKSH